MRKKYIRNTTTAISTLFLLAPFVVNAALVTCGNDVGDICTYDDFIILANNILQFALFKIAIPITIVMIVYGGILIMSSGGNETKVKKGKDVITGTFIGLAIAFGAWLIVNTVISVFFK